MKPRFTADEDPPRHLEMAARPEGGPPTALRSLLGVADNKLQFATPAKGVTHCSYTAL